MVKVEESIRYELLNTKPDENHEGRFVDVGGLRLHYVNHGSGREVVFLHGNAGSVHDWTAVFDEAAREMIDAGLAVVLATDFNPGSSPTVSMPMILSLASTHMKMTPAESLTAATINAAYSLGRGA